MPDPYARLADAFLGHYETVRGAVRYALAARQLDPHLPPPPARVVDIGGGAGQQAIRLAERGYQVALVDPSREMLDRARETLRRCAPGTRRKLTVIEAYGEETPDIFAGSQFEIVLCQGVLMYLDDPAPMVEALSRVTAPGGIISIIAKNRSALAMRSALEARWRDAVEAISAEGDVGGVGIVTRGDDLESLSNLLTKYQCTVEQWYGIRVFTDHLGKQAPGPDLNDVLEAEWLAGQRDPYRSVARLIHVIATKSTSTA